MLIIFGLHTGCSHLATNPFATVHETHRLLSVLCRSGYSNSAPTYECPVSARVRWCSDSLFLGSPLRCTLVERLSLKALQLVVYIQGQGGSQRSVLATLHTSPPLYTLPLLSKMGVLVTGLFGKITKVVRLSACKSNIRKMRAGVRRIPTI